MTDRYIIEFKEGGVDAMEAVLTGGTAIVMEKVIDTVTGDDNHGWYCTIVDRETNLKDSQWGITKSEAQEKTFNSLISKIDAHLHEQKRLEQARHEEIIKQRENQRARESLLEKERHTYQTSSEDNSTSDGACLGYVIGIGLVIWLIAMAVWAVIAIGLPLVAINIAIIAFIFSFIRKNWQIELLSLSVLGAIFIIFDYNLGWTTKILVENANFFKKAIPYFFNLNFAIGLVAAYFLIRKILILKNPEVLKVSEFSKRNLIVIGSLLFVGIITLGLQNYIDSGKSLNFKFITQEKSSLSNNSVNKEKDQNQEVKSELNSTSINKNNISQNQKPQSLRNSELNETQNLALPEVNDDTKLQRSTNLTRQNVASNSDLSSFSEKESVQIIKYLFTEDNSKDINKFLSYFSENVEKYWELINPSKSKIKNTVKSRWQRHINSSNKIIKIELINHNTYKVSNEYSYTERKSGLIKKTISIITIRFDHNGKINYLDGKQN